MRFASLVVFAIALAPACTLHWGGDDTGDDVCAAPARLDSTDSTDHVGDVPIYIADLRNPENLICEQYGGGGCGYQEPAPSWGQCYSACESLDETTCAAAAECRLVKDAECT